MPLLLSRIVALDGCDDSVLTFSSHIQFSLHACLTHSMHITEYTQLHSGPIAD